MRIEIGGFSGYYVNPFCALFLVLQIPYHKSFAAIPSVCLVHLGHTNRSFVVSHEWQREIALV